MVKIWKRGKYRGNFYGQLFCNVSETQLKLIWCFNKFKTIDRKTTDRKRKLEQQIGKILNLLTNRN